MSNRAALVEDALRRFHDAIALGKPTVEIFRCNAEALLAEIAWLRKCEAAIASMAGQICSPATSPEDFVADVLGEPRQGKRRATR